MPEPEAGEERETVGHDAAVEARWYACQVMSRAEKKVAEYLGQRGFESFLPLLTVTSQWKDRKKRVRLPLFRGYVFARFPVDRYGDVLRTPRLANVVRIGGAPAPIPDEEIENVRRFAERLAGTSLEPEPVHEFVEGERVRLVGPPFDGVVEGVVTTQRGVQRVTVHVGVRLIGQFVRIALNPEDLEPLDISPPGT